MKKLDVIGKDIVQLVQTFEQNRTGSLFCEIRKTLLKNWTKNFSGPKNVLLTALAMLQSFCTVVAKKHIVSQKTYYETLYHKNVCLGIKLAALATGLPAILGSPVVEWLAWNL